MSDLRIWLLAAGVLVVLGVFAYNARQERRARRGAEQAFGSGHADALMGEGAARKEPTFAPAPRREIVPEAAALPDVRLDYVVELGLRALVSAEEVSRHWAPFEHRFAGRALLAASPDRHAWRALAAAGRCGVRCRGRSPSPRSCSPATTTCSTPSSSTRAPPGCRRCGR